MNIHIQLPYHPSATSGSEARIVYVWCIWCRACGKVTAHLANGKCLECLKRESNHAEGINANAEQNS